MTDLGDFGEHDADAAPESDFSSESDPSTTDSESTTDEFETTTVEPRGDDVGIGAVCVSQGLRVAEDGDETTLRAYITRGNRSSIRIGSYLVAPYPDGAANAASPARASGHDGETLFCRIIGSSTPSSTTPTTRRRSTPDARCAPRASRKPITSSSPNSSPLQSSMMMMANSSAG